MAYKDERENGREQIIVDIMANNFPKLVKKKKDITPHIQKAQQNGKFQYKNLKRRKKKRKKYRI